MLVGAERHETVDVALRYLGLGRPEVVPADDQGRIDVEALAAALAAGTGTAGRPIVALQAGNVHSGAFDDFERAIAIAHEHGAWVHVDGAFGLFAAAAPYRRHLVRGVAAADSWTTDAHKTLNVPYDCGLAIVREPAALRAAMGMHGDYLIKDDAGDPFEKVPESSRRARAVPVWAVLRALGRSGVAELVEGFCRHAAALRRRRAGDPRRRGRQRRRLHPGLRLLRQRRAHRGGGPRAAGGRHGVDVRLALARPLGAADLGQQLGDHRRRRRPQPRGRTPGGRPLLSWARRPVELGPPPR